MASPLYIHACRADYVTYCNARNAYKQKISGRARETQRFRGGASPIPEASKVISTAFKREKEEVGATEIRAESGIEIITRKE